MKQPRWPHDRGVVPLRHKPWPRLARWLYAVCLLGLTAGCHYQPSIARFASLVEPPGEPTVQLWYATVPQLPAAAYHGWFLSFDPDDGQWRRWEVWHEPGSDCSKCGHVMVDRLPPAEGMDGKSGWPVLEWRGAQALEIQAVLARGHIYPYQQRYRYWPGPNSNTFVAWVLREAKAPAELPPQAIGKDYLGSLAGADVTVSRTGVQAETPILGLAVGLREGIELHILCLTLGVDVWPPALKTPVGRLGFGGP